MRWRNHCPFCLWSLHVDVNPGDAGVILWLSEKDTVTWMPIKEMEKAYEAGLKSLNPAVLMKNGYKFVNIPSEKQRVFMKSNYSILIQWAEEQN